MISKIAIRLVVVTVLALGIILSPKGHIDQYVVSKVMAPVKTSNDLYLKESFNRALTGFLVLSGIKSGLAVIEGSEIGIGFNLELGDIVQSVYDYVDIAWKTVLAGATVLYFTQLIIRMVELIDQIFLTATFIAFLVMVIVHWYLPGYRKIYFYLREFALSTLILSLSLYILLPLTIKGSSYISEKVSSPVILEAQNNFSNIESSFSMEEMRKNLFPDEEQTDEGWLSKLDVSKNMEHIKERFEHVKEQLAEKSEQVAAWTIKLIVGYLFDCIVFPALFILTFILFIKAVFGVLSRDNLNRMIKNDVETVFRQYSPAQPSSDGMS